MRQRAVVLKTDNGIAEIEVSRATMCDGCQKNGDCGHSCELSGIISGGKKMTTNAVNKIGARVGDTVEVETESKKVLGYAALVFAVPIFVCAFFYFLADVIFDTEAVSLAAAGIGFVLSFVGLSLFDRVKKKAPPDIVIVSVLTDL